VVREEILERFKKWLDEVLAEEEPPDGIVHELLLELEEKADLDSLYLPGSGSDLYSLWSAVIALTQEVKLQGRAFNRLSDRLEPLEGLGDSDARRIPEESHTVRTGYEDKLVQEIKRSAVREVLTVLLDTHNRLVRGLDAVHKATQGLDKYRPSSWLRRIFSFSRQKERTDHVLKIVSALEEGYRLSLDRLNEALQQLGVREIVCEGHPFDPTTMNAVDVEENIDAPDGTVLEVYRTGYIWDAEVLYPAQVKVARTPDTGAYNNRNEPEAT